MAGLVTFNIVFRFIRLALEPTLKQTNFYIRAKADSLYRNAHLLVNTQL